MRILLLNDTSNNSHLGCAAVSNAIRQFLFNVDGLELRTIFNRELQCDYLLRFPPAAEAWLVESIRWCDLLVVNGEGSLHHSRSLEIVRAIQIAEDEAVPFCVVNSILEDFPSLMPVLARAEVVSLRDGASLRTAQMSGVPAVRCADAALFASFSDLSFPIVGEEIGVTDWHPMAPAETLSIATRHLATGANFYPLTRPDANWIWPSVVKNLGRFKHVVCGRYHGALFALLGARPLTLLPSNSWKMHQLLVDLSILDETEYSEMEWPFEVSEASARLARERLLIMRQTPELHPLFNIQLETRNYRIGRLETGSRPIKPMLGIPDTQANASVLARRLADWLTFLGAPLGRRERLSCDEILTTAGTEVLRATAELLTLEGQQTAGALVLTKLVELGAVDSAFPIALSLRNRAPFSAEANFVFALIANSRIDAVSASAFIEMADAKKPLLASSARLAARIAGRAGDNQTKARLLKNSYGPTMNLSGEQWRELAVTAGLAELSDLAVHAARSALQAEPALTGWPGIQAANMLASNGEFTEGCQKLSLLLPSADEEYRQMLTKATPSNAGTVVYMPPLIGVGSAVLATLPLLSDVFAFKGPVSLIVDKRLHPAFSRVLGSHVVLLSDAKDFHSANIGRVVNGFDLLAGFGAKYGDQGSPPILKADPARYADLQSDYRGRFGNSKLVGLAWQTGNRRSRGWRNLSPDHLRALLSKHSEIVFVSLQADVENAVADRELIMRSNLFVDTRIDPRLSIEDQLAQISVLDHVISVDCSSGIFAAAIGIQSTIVLHGEPTWQWPERQSFFANASIVKDLAEADRTLSSLEYGRA